MLKAFLKRAVPPSIRYQARQLQRNVARLGRWAPRVGAMRAIGYAVAELPRAHGTTYALNAPGLRHAVHLRPYTSDFEVFANVALEGEFDELPIRAPVRRIIDCGANIGMASLTLLSRFPEATVIAVEPDPGNFELLRRNLDPYAARVRLVRAGVWPYQSSGVVDTPWRDGRAWSIRVRPLESGEVSDVPLVDIPTLMETMGWPDVDLVKMDIEGAECTVLDEGARRWLLHTRVFAVELHDAAGEAAFERAVPRDEFDVSRLGELTIAVRRSDSLRA
jgi:FkbM family methyltransferase